MARWNPWRPDWRHWQSSRNHWRPCQLSAGHFARRRAPYRRRRGITVADIVALVLLLGSALVIGWLCGQ